MTSYDFTRIDLQGLVVLKRR